MNLGLGQSLRQDLQLRLSPQLLQRIEVLQLPALDLAEMIDQELQQNEALEVDSDLEAPSDAEAADDAGDEALDRLEEYLGDDEWTPSRDDTAVSRTEVLEATAAAETTLADHLGQQLDLLELEPRVRAVADALIQALDSRGWLGIDPDELQVELSPPPTQAERDRALHVLQGLEPSGVGCRDLVECLLLQLEEAGADDSLVTTLVVNHLDDIARNRIPKLVRETGVEVDELLAAIDVISHLDPIPGRRFGTSRVPVVRPDVSVYRVGDDYEISLENDRLPVLTVSRSCLDMARDRGVDRELRKHIRGKIEAARSLIDAVEQRKHTLFRVASEIVNRQPGFLESGRAALRPLRMQEVADVLGVHVSTISRAISGKYLQTPHGIVPMKALFTGGVASSEGADGSQAEGASRASVQELVRSIIDAEDKAKPLSDEAIVGRLDEQHGLKVARRTVTKYRKALGLGSSRDRRQYGES